MGDGSGPGVVACQSCIHWWQPDGQPVKPDYRRGLSAEWWARSGYCTRFAPSPSTEEVKRTFWRVVNAADGCGDGQAVEFDDAVCMGDLTGSARPARDAVPHDEPLPALT